MIAVAFMNKWKREVEYYAEKITYTFSTISGRPDDHIRKSAVSQKGFLSGKHPSGYPSLLCDEET